MSDFTDFLAAMAIEDSMEEKGQNASPGRPSGSSGTKTSRGCLLGCIGIFLACGLGVAFKSFWLLAGLSAASFVFGIVYDIRAGRKKDSAQE